jgi:fluoride exporter
MNAGTFVAACVAGGVGALLRYIVDSAVSSRAKGDGFPWGTFIINVSGSFLLGVVTGLASVMILEPALRLALGSGLLGGYTTFSTASVQTWNLVENHKHVAAALFAGGMLASALLAAWAGMWLGGLCG